MTAVAAPIRTRDFLSHSGFRHVGGDLTDITRHDAEPKIRRTAMSMLVEELARDRMRQAHRDVDAYRLARRVRNARRAARKAAR